MNNKAKKAICRKEDLGNEASVEQFFVDRLLKRLGWSDSQIKTKESISELSINLGRKKIPYKPDYALSYRRKVRFVIDAKSTKENLDDWVGQCSSYCLLINQGYKDNPVQYFVITNGLKTMLYRWDSRNPVLTLSLSDMNKGSKAFDTFSMKEKQEIKKNIAENCIWGIDAARDPALARIARMNMFLHGDGGSKIFQLDSLDKNITVEEDADSLELRSEKKEFRDAISGRNGYFDLALTNPPFAAEYKCSEPSDLALLKDYSIAHRPDGNGISSLRGTVRSSVLFIERYYDILKPGGSLITVLDDGILGGEDTSYVRDWIRSHFIVKAVISLPGDAFQRSQARVKTSLLFLQKKIDAAQEQPRIYMRYCSYVGLDSPNRERVLPSDAITAQKAKEEITDIVDGYKAFLDGDSEIARLYSVDPKRIENRMDVKATLLVAGRNVEKWNERGFKVRAAKDIAEPIWASGAACEDRAGDLFCTRGDNKRKKVTFAVVKYDGTIAAGDESYAEDVSYESLFKLKKDDVVLSNINAVNGAVAVVDSKTAGLYVSSEYTVIQPKDPLTVYTLWSLIRSDTARSDLILLSTGIGRTRISWDVLSELKLPVPNLKAIQVIQERMEELAETRKKEAALLEEVSQLVNIDICNSDERALSVLTAFKPPK